MTEPTIHVKDAAALWHSATTECRMNWAKAADLPKMPSELLLIAKDPLIGQALAKWCQDVCELVVGLRERLKRLDAQTVPVVRQGEHNGGDYDMRHTVEKPVPVEPDEVSEMRSYIYRQAETCIKYIDSLTSALQRAQEERDSLRQQMPDIEAEVERQIDRANERAEKAEAMAEQCQKIAHDWGQGVTDAETAIRALHKLFPIDGGKEK